MSLKSKFISIFTVAAGVVVFSTAGLAQDDKATTTTTTPDKVERRHRGEGWKQGDHKADGEGSEGRHHGHGRMGGRGMMGMMRGVNLTDAQKEQIRTIRESNRPDAAAMAQIKAIHEARKAGTEITPEQQAQLKAFREQFRAKSRAAHEQILALLTDEQKAQIEKNKAEMKQRFEERRKERELRKNDPAGTTKDRSKDNDDN